jgi:hypothetical protein
LRVEEKAKLEECGAASHHIRKEEIDGLVAVTQFVFENFSSSLRKVAQRMETSEVAIATAHYASSKSS